MIRQLGYLIPTCLLVLSACSGEPAASGGLSDPNSMKPTAADMQGAPLQLNSTYKGNCAYAYKGGAKSSNCTATLDAAQSGEDISLVLNVAIDGQQNQITTGNFRIVGNRIEDEKGSSSGAIGTGAVRIDGSDFGTLSIRPMTDGTVGVLATQLPNMAGDMTNGYAFVGSLK